MPDFLFHSSCLLRIIFGLLEFQLLWYLVSLLWSKMYSCWFQAATNYIYCSQPVISVEALKTQEQEGTLFVFDQLQFLLSRQDKNLLFFLLNILKREPTKFSFVIFCSAGKFLFQVPLIIKWSFMGTTLTQRWPHSGSSILFSHESICFYLWNISKIN